MIRFMFGSGTYVFICVWFRYSLLYIRYRMFGLDITPVAYGSLVSRVRYFAAILRAEASR